MCQNRRITVNWTLINPVVMNFNEHKENENENMCGNAKQNTFSAIFWALIIKMWNFCLLFLWASALIIGMLISVPFILATILVYICLPELRNLHGKCLLCYLIGLSVGYFFMALIQLNGRNFISPLICKPVGYLTYFSFMSAFLWLSVISFDLWWIFR